ncbi:MAG TPA: lytic transglycosylase domain-containing protein, partial [Caulobacteraceae bacterium]|nr:lytic transglycosylase domain-containing protein [Caulobacteraceae bacterium]
MTCIRAVLAVCAVVLTGALAPQAKAASLATLTAQDAQLYASAFQAAEQGDFAGVDTALARVSDPCLVGRVQYVKLTNPASRGASYADLVSWLSAFKDLPGADKIYALAMKLKPQGAQPPAPVAAVLVDGEVVKGRAAPQSYAARDAYFGGDLSRALKLAKSSGDVWIAGLAAYRLGDFGEALADFEAVARHTG